MKSQLLKQARFSLLGAISIPTLLSSFASPGLAGTITVENSFRPSSSSGRPSASITTGTNRDLFCQYTPTGQSVVSPNSFLTLLEVQGNSTFRYERTDTALVAGLPPSDTSRTLTFFNTSAEQARRQLANRPNDYANLLGLAPTHRIARAGFSSIDRQFRCQPYDDVIAAAQQPQPADSPQYSSIASLPDGNYRVTSAPNALDTDSLDLEALNSQSDSFQNSALFTFRKLGDTVTGNFAYLGSDLNACITGSIEGNTVTGQAFTRNSGTAVIGQSYLGPGLSLRLGEVGVGGLFPDERLRQRYDNAILDLNGFTRINAGTRVPPAVCS